MQQPNNAGIRQPVQDPNDPGQIAFWMRTDAICAVACRQLLDTEVNAGIDGGFIAEIPHGHLLPFFWGRAAVLVQIEAHMSKGVVDRDLQNAVNIAKEMQPHLALLGAETESKERTDAERVELVKLYADLREALAKRPHHPQIADQTYGGLIPEPSRIQLVRAV